MQGPPHRGHLLKDHLLRIFPGGVENEMLKLHHIPLQLLESHQIQILVRVRRNLTRLIKMLKLCKFRDDLSTESSA